MILCGVESRDGIGNLEVVRDYIIEMFNDKYIEDVVVLTGVLSQMNLIIEKIYDIDDDSDLKRDYWIMRKHILAWLEEKYTKPQVDNQE